MSPRSKAIVTVRPLSGPGRRFDPDEALARVAPLIAGAREFGGAFTDAVLRDYLASWQHGFEREQSEYKSFVVFAEMKLRQVLLATAGAAPEQPSTQRLAAVFDCLDRLSSLFGRYGPIIHVIRNELLRALYHDWEPAMLGQGAAYYALRTPYFVRALSAERELAALRATMGDWEQERSGAVQSRAWDGILQGIDKVKEAKQDEQLSELRAELQKGSAERFRDPQARLLDTIASSELEQRRMLVLACIVEFGGEAVRGLSVREQAAVLGGLLAGHESHERANTLGVMLATQVPASERSDLVGAIADATQPGAPRVRLALAVTDNSEEPERTGVLLALFEARPAAGPVGKLATLQALLESLKPAERVAFLSASLAAPSLDVEDRRSLVTHAALNLEQSASGGSQAELLVRLLAGARADARTLALVGALSELGAAELGAVLQAVAKQSAEAVTVEAFAAGLGAAPESARGLCVARVTDALGWEAKEKVVKSALRSVQMAAVIPEGTPSAALGELAAVAFEKLSSDEKAAWLRTRFARRQFDEPSLGMMLSGLRMLGHLHPRTDPAAPRHAGASGGGGPGSAQLREAALTMRRVSHLVGLASAHARPLPPALERTHEHTAEGGEGEEEGGDGRDAEEAGDSEESSSSLSASGSDDDAEGEEGSAAARTRARTRRRRSSAGGSGKGTRLSEADRAALRARRAARNPVREANVAALANAEGVPLQQLLRMIGDLYDKKATEDALADARARPRMSLSRYIKDYCMRQYGVRSMASRSLIAITVATRRYGGEQRAADSHAHPRVRTFGLMSGLLTDVAWPTRKADFLLRIHQELCARSGGIARVLSDAKACVPYDAARAAISALALDREVRRELHEAAWLSAFVPAPPAGPGPAGAAGASAADGGPGAAAATAAAGGGGSGGCGSAGSSDNSKRAVVAVDEFALSVLEAWEAAEALEELAAQDALLAIFQTHDADGNRLLSFTEFVNCVHSCTAAAASFGREKLLDLYDDALRLSAEETGHETDMIEPQAFCRLMLAQGLFDRPNARFVEAIASSADAARPAPDDSAASFKRPSPRESTTVSGLADPQSAVLLAAVAAAAAASPGRRQQQQQLLHLVPGPAPPPSPAHSSPGPFSNANLARPSPSLGLGVALATFGGGGGMREPPPPAHVPKSEGTTARLRDALRHNFLFRALPEALLEECVAVLRPLAVSKGSRIAKQGERADCFIVVEEGHFDALALPAALLPAAPSDAQPRRQQAGGAEGSAAAANPRVRRASFRATAAAAALAVAPLPGQPAAGRAAQPPAAPMGGARRPSISAGGGGAAAAAAAAFSAAGNGRRVSSAGRDAHRSEAQPRAELDLSSAVLVESYRPVAGKPLPCFGELSLLYAKPRSATVLARTEGLVWTLDRYAFRTVQSLASLSYAPSDSALLLRLLARVEILRPLSSDELRQLREGLVERSLGMGEYLAVQGETPEDADDALVILVAGRARAVRTEEGSTRPLELAVLEEGQSFGSRELLGRHKREASVICVSEVKVACLSRAHFEKALGPLQRLLQASDEHRLSLDADRRQRVQTLGIGSIGRRALAFSRRVVELRSCGALFNTTQLSSGSRLTLFGTPKAELARSVERDAIFAQPELLQGVHASLARQATGADAGILPAFLTAFHDAGNAYLLFEGWLLCPLAELRTPMDEETAKYVCASVALLLHGLHDHASTICRGIHANDLYVAADGRLSPVLLRNAKRLDSGLTYTVCGVKAHLSPETIRGEGYGFSTDFWALGVLLFELLTARSPFVGEDRAASVASSLNEVGLADGALDANAPEGARGAGMGDREEVAVYERILGHRRGTLRPRVIQLRLHERRPPVSDGCTDFLEALLMPSTADRLGSANGPTELMGHPWLADFDWASLKPGGVVGSPLLDEANAIAERAAKSAFADGRSTDAGLVAEPYSSTELDRYFTMSADAAADASPSPR